VLGLSRMTIASVIMVSLNKIVYVIASGLVTVQGVITIAHLKVSVVGVSISMAVGSRVIMSILAVVLLLSLIEENMTEWQAIHFVVFCYCLLFLFGLLCLFFD